MLNRITDLRRRRGVDEPGAGRTTNRRYTSGGYTLAELMTTIAVMAVIAAITITVIIFATRTTANQGASGRLWASIQDANVQLQRDINDASRVVHADTQSVSVLVIRNDTCEQRTWNADTDAGTLSVETRRFQSASCSGASTVASQTVVGGAELARFTSEATFAFFEAANTPPLTGEIEAERVRRVEWVLTGTPDPSQSPRTLQSAAAVTPRHIQFGGGEHQTPGAARLFRALRAGDVSTAAAGGCNVPSGADVAGRTEGRDQPVLFWCDPTPDLTLGWTVWRLANPEGMAADDPARTTWTRVATISETHFTDQTLPDGYTAQYVVRALVASGLGPTSNQVITGLRPAANTLTATGVGNQINLQWDVPVGATGFDIFRFDAADGRTPAPNGHLIARLTGTDTLTFSDGTDAVFPDVAVGDQNAAFRRDSWPGTNPVAGYGHTHNYVVVPTNRWEDVARGQAGQNRPSERANLGSTLASWRNASPRQGAFTAPAAPSLSVSVPSTSGSIRQATLTWTPAPWNGSGPAAWATRWHPQHRMSNAGPTAMAVVGAQGNGAAAVVTRHGAGVNGNTLPGRWYEYAVQGENAAGRGPLSNMNVGNGVASWVRAWQRPANPTATATQVAGAPNNTRAIDVRGTLAATADESYAANRFTMQQATRGGNDASPTGWQTQAANGAFRFDRINHDSTRRFEVRVQGNGGFSDVVSVNGTTARLVASQPTITASSTRRIAASFTATNGNARHLILEGGQDHGSMNRTVTGTTANWDRLRDGHNFVVRSRNSDGHNRVESTRSQATPAIHVTATTRLGSQPTRSVCANATSNNASIQRLTIGGVAVSNNGCNNNLSHDTNHAVVATAGDGLNTRNFNTSHRTHLLNVSVTGWHGSRPTRELCGRGSSNNASMESLTIGGVRVGTSEGCNDRLAHGTTFQFVATATDGHNRRSVTGAGTTNVLAAPATPTCTASASPNNFVGATVRWTSNGSLSRTSATANAAGWWSATATRSNSDGFNSRTSTNSCGVQIQNRPWTVIGSGGTPSQSCEHFRTWGEVRDRLDASLSGAQNLVVGSFIELRPISGASPRHADAGSVLRSSPPQCAMWRRHRIMDRALNTQVGVFFAATTVIQGGGGGIV